MIRGDEFWEKKDRPLWTAPESPGAALPSPFQCRGGARSADLLPVQARPLAEVRPRSCGASPRRVVHPRSIHSPRRFGFTSRLQISLLVKGGVGGFRLQRGTLVIKSRPKIDYGRPPLTQLVTKVRMQRLALSNFPVPFITSNLHLKVSPHACPPPIPPGIARAACHPPGLAPPAVRATEARLSPSHPPSPRAFLARSLAKAAHAVVFDRLNI